MGWHGEVGVHEETRKQQPVLGVRTSTGCPSFETSSGPRIRNSTVPPRIVLHCWEQHAQYDTNTQYSHLAYLVWDRPTQ